MWENLPGQDMGVIDRLMIFFDSLDGGAWSHLVGAVICQVYLTFRNPLNSPNHSIGRSDGRCVQRAGT